MDFAPGFLMVKKGSIKYWLIKVSKKSDYPEINSALTPVNCIT